MDIKYSKADENCLCDVMRYGPTSLKVQSLMDIIRKWGRWKEANIDTNYLIWQALRVNVQSRNQTLEMNYHVLPDFVK